MFGKGVGETDDEAETCDGTGVVIEFRRLLNKTTRASRGTRRRASRVMDLRFPVRVPEVRRVLESLPTDVLTVGSDCAGLLTEGLMPMTGSESPEPCPPPPPLLYLPPLTSLPCPPLSASPSEREKRKRSTSDNGVAWNAAARRWTRMRTAGHAVSKPAQSDPTVRTSVGKDSSTRTSGTRTGNLRSITRDARRRVPRDARGVLFNSRRNSITTPVP